MNDQSALLQDFGRLTDDLRCAVFAALPPSEALALCMALGCAWCRAPLPHSRLTLRPLPSAAAQAEVASWLAARFPRLETLVLEAPTLANKAVAAPGFIRGLAALQYLSTLGNVDLPLTIADGAAGALAALPALRKAHLVVNDLSGAGALELAGSGARLHLFAEQLDAPVLSDVLRPLAAADVASLRIGTYDRPAELGDAVQLLGRLTLLTRLHVRTDNDFTVECLASLTQLQDLFLMTHLDVSFGVRDVTRLTGLTSLAVGDIAECNDELAAMEPSLPAMSRLQRLRLRNMDMEGSLIQGAQIALIARLPALRELLVEDGYEEDDDSPAALRCLTGVTRLSLDRGDNYPSISPAACKAIATLTQLRSLIAPVCSVPGVNVCWSALQHLEHLEVFLSSSHDTFVVDGGSWILQLTRLTGLLVVGTVTDAFAAGAAAQLSSLRDLQIESCPAQDGEANVAIPTPVCAAALAELACLTALKLNRLPVGNAAAGALAHLPHLRQLDLASCDIGDAGACVIAELGRHLTSVAVGDCVGTSGIAALGRLPRMANLSVCGHVTDEGALALVACAQRLTSLLLSLPGWRPASLAPETTAALKRLPCLRYLWSVITRDV